MIYYFVSKLFLIAFIYFFSLSNSISNFLKLVETTDQYSTKYLRTLVSVRNDRGEVESSLVRRI